MDGMIPEAIVGFLAQSSDVDTDVSASRIGMRVHGFEGPVSCEGMKQCDSIELKIIIIRHFVR